MEIDQFLLKSGRVNSALIKEKNFKIKYNEKYKEIEIFSKEIKIDERSFAEKLYHYINKEEHGKLCKNCKTKKTKFFGIKRGYADFCSSKCSNGSTIVQNKKKEVYLEKYGVDNPSKNKQVIERIQDKFTKKYGANPFSLQNVKDQIKKTCMEKYGTEYSLSGKSPVREKINRNKEKEFREKYKDLNITYYNPKKWGECRILCNDCNQEYEISKWNLHQRNEANTIKCTHCNPIGSDTETSIESFIKSILKNLKINYIEKSRKILDDGREIDIYIPDQKIAIEINGIFWHSDSFKEKNYHKSKTDACLDKGIRLIHIMEDEIFNSPEITKSRISSILSKSDKKIWARKCSIKEVDKRESINFLNDNHIQGACGSSYSIGLYLNDELISLMTFGKLRKSLGSNNKEGVWELLRFCNKINTNVVGGASKLMDRFINEKLPSKIISYCDRRWSPDGNLYRKLGFTFIHNTNPNYWYYKNNSYKKYHRFNFRKDALVKDGFDQDKTEFEIMNERKFIRVYDCGSSKWELDPQKKED